MSDNINDQRGRRASGGANGRMGLLNLVGLLGGGKKKILLLVVIAVVFHWCAPSTGHAKRD